MRVETQQIEHIYDSVSTLPKQTSFRNEIHRDSLWDGSVSPTEPLITTNLVEDLVEESLPEISATNSISVSPSVVPPKSDVKKPCYQQIHRKKSKSEKMRKSSGVTANDVLSSPVVVPQISTGSLLRQSIMLNTLWQMKTGNLHTSRKYSNGMISEVLDETLVDRDEDGKETRVGLLRRMCVNFLRHKGIKLAGMPYEKTLNKLPLDAMGKNVARYKEIREHVLAAIDEKYPFLHARNFL